MRKIWKSRAPTQHMEKKHKHKTRPQTENRAVSHIDKTFLYFNVFGEGSRVHYLLLLASKVDTNLFSPSSKCNGLSP